MGIRLITPPAAVEPVTLAEAKTILRVTHSDDDAIIQPLVSAAREWVERRVQHKLALQTWELVIDSFPTDEILLPFGPVQSITSIKYDDELGDEYTVISTDYALDNTSLDPWIFTEDGWPATGDLFNAVRVRFVAGYADMTLVPMVLRAAIYLKLKELYDGEQADNAINNLLTNYYKMVA